MPRAATTRFRASCTMEGVDHSVDLVVPIKRLDRAKSRLRGALDTDARRASCSPCCSTR